MSAVAAPLVNRAATVTKPVAARPPLLRIASPPVTVQCASSLRVSSPHDPAEKEAEATARRVMYQPAPAHGLRGIADAARPSTQLARMAGHIVQRDTALARIMRQGVPPSLRQSGLIARAQQEGQPSTSANIDAEIRSSQSTGTPLPPSVRRFMEPRFAADFGNVRVHTGDKAAKLSRQLSARAFTVGSSIFFGEGQYQPDSQDGRELLAHELTHTIQQGAATQALPVQRSTVPEVRQRSGDLAQRGFLPDPFEYISNKANSIPGFTMFTVVIGFNPVTKASVDRSAGNILRGAIELIPGGSYITEALNNHGIFDKISTWTKTQFDTLKDIGSNIWTDIKQFVKGLGPRDLGDLEGAWNRGKRILTGPIDQMIAFAKNLKDGIVQLIKDAILKPIGAYAQTTSGYKILCGIMGSDPITGDAASLDGEQLMGSFMDFIGQGDTWATIKTAKAIPRTVAWFKQNTAILKQKVASIPSLFVTALKSLTIADIVLIPLAFVKLGKVFANFAGDFISWGAKAVWDLLEIVFDVVKPGVMGYVKRTGGAIKGILKNPMPFVGNLARAAKTGFNMFAGNFLNHLKSGLLNWLTGSLPGVYIPKSFALLELFKLGLSVLGLTWANMRAKLVKVLGEPAVAVAEGTVEVVKTLVREGPVAAWAQIKGHLSNLTGMIVDGITSLVVDAVVKKAIPKVVAMFIPGAGFISAILSIVDLAVTVYAKIKQIAAVGSAIVSSIVQIAAGNIGAAAKKVESILAGMLSLAISFLAGFAGLGKIADKIMGVIQKIRAPVDKALDAAIAWVAGIARKLLGKIMGKDKAADERSPAEKQADLDKGIAEAQALQSDPKATEASIRKGLGKIKSKYKMKSLDIVVDADSELEETLHVTGEVNPKKSTPSARIQKDGTVGPLGIVRKMLSWTADTLKRLFKDPIWNKFKAKLRGKYESAGLAIRHKVSISDTIKNTDAAIAPKKPEPAADLLAAKGYPVEGKPKTKPKIVASARSYLQAANNDPNNLFIGDAFINSVIVKERYDAGDSGDASAAEHVAQREDFVETWGFKDEEFVITMQRKSKRLGTSLETETRKSSGKSDVPVSP